MGKIIQNYALQQIVGQGMYGKVYKAIHLKSKEQFAVKVIPSIKFQQNPKLEQCTVQQIKILSTIQTSPYIIRYIQMLKTPNNFYFIYEYCNGKTLESLLKQQGKLPEAKALKIFKQLIQAFKVLNKYNIMHRDLKPDNIFFHNNNVKLGDFGFCKSLQKANDMASTMLGSPIYMAPQVLKGQIYTSKADIWSLGVVLYQMLFGFCPFQSNSIAKLISVLSENQLKIPLQINNISVSTQNLLKKLLVKDHFKRIDWLELLQYTISQQGQINQKKISHNKLEQLSLVRSQREFSKYLNQPMTQNTDYSLGLKKNIQTNSNSSSTNFSNSSSSTTSKIGITNTNNNVNNHNFNNNSSFNKKFLKSTKLPQEDMKNNQSVQNQVSNSTPKKNTYQDSINSQNLYMGQFKKQNNEWIGNKRKKLLEEHSLCVNGIKTAIIFFKSQEFSSLVYSYILFLKIQDKLKKCIIELTNQTQLEDIYLAFSGQLKQIQRLLLQIKQQLKQNSFDLTELSDIKTYLKSKFKDKNEHNLKQWYDMISFLNGNKPALYSRDMSNLELTITINNFLM